MQSFRGPPACLCKSPLNHHKGRLLVLHLSGLTCLALVYCELPITLHTTADLHSPALQCCLHVEQQGLSALQVPVVTHVPGTLPLAQPHNHPFAVELWHHPPLWCRKRHLRIDLVTQQRPALMLDPSNEWISRTLRADVYAASALRLSVSANYQHAPGRPCADQWLSNMGRNSSSSGSAACLGWFCSRFGCLPDKA